MIEHQIMPPFCTEWWLYNSITIFIILLLIFWGKLLSKKDAKLLTFFLAIFFIFEFIFMDVHHLYNKTWSLQDSLPLHLCSLMWLLSIYLLLTKKQWAFEMILFIGMPGGIHSLLTPELTHGNQLIHKIDFFIGHGGLILVAFYAIFIMGMWPRKKAWLYSFFRLQVLVFFVGLINFLIGSNYMYLLQPPIADNPLIPSGNSLFGKWPYYILVFELAVFMHAMVINLPFMVKSRDNN